MFYPKKKKKKIGCIHWHNGTIDNKSSSFFDHVFQHFQIRSREKKINIR